MANLRMSSQNSVTGFRGPSPTIFGDLGALEQKAREGQCILIDDDFAMPTNHVSTGTSGGYYTYQDNGVTITGKGVNDLGEELGVLEFAGNDTDNDEGHIQFGYGNQWRLSNAAGNTGCCGFEYRLYKASVADNGVSIAAGLFEGPVAADDLDDNTGEIKDSKSFIGFRGLADDGDKLDIIYQDTSATSVVTVLANAVTLVANTYVRLGMLYDPNSDTTRKIRFFSNGTEIVNARINTTSIDTSTFPEDEGMVPVLLTKVGTDAESKVALDRVTAFLYMDGAEGHTYA